MKNKIWLVPLLLITISLLITSCGGTPPKEPAQNNRPEEILVLERKGFDFRWEEDRWEDRDYSAEAVFFYFPNGLTEGWPPSFGYSTSVHSTSGYSDAIIDFFFAFDMDYETQIWLLDLAGTIIDDGEPGGKSCYRNVCCSFFYDYPDAKFSCSHEKWW